MARPRLNVTEQRELRHLLAISSAGGTLPVITNARAGEGIDGRSARALAGKELVQLAPADDQLFCSLTSQGETRLAVLVLKSTGAHSCRNCGCTDDDCSGCIERTGYACHWVEADLCSACSDEGRAAMPSKHVEFDSHLPNLLREAIVGHPSPGPLVMAMNLTIPIIRAVAQRAIELDDPELNILMLRLALYEVPAAERIAAIEAQQARLEQNSN